MSESPKASPRRHILGYGRGISLYRIAQQAHGGCMVCGDVGCNPGSLGVEFVQAGDGAVKASFPVTSRHQGYDGLLHGGMIGTLLDAAMTHCLFAQGIQALTAEMTVRFIAPIETGGRVTVTARLLGQTHGIYRLESEMFRKKQLLARAAAKFVRPKTEF